MVLNFVTAGSATFSALHYLEPVFLTITLLLFMDNIRREGFTRRNLQRGLMIAFTTLLVPRLLKMGMAFMRKEDVVVKKCGCEH